MKTLLNSIKLWRASVAGTRWPLFWLLSRPLFAIIPFLTIAFVFFEGGSGLFFIYLVSMSATLTYFLRNCFRIEKLIHRSGLNPQELGQERMYNVLFIRSAIEFASPLVVLFTLILRHDLITLFKWFLLTLIELSFLLFLAKGLAPVVIYFLSKWQDTRHFLRYLNAIIMVSALALLHLTKEQSFFLCGTAFIPLVSFCYFPTLLYVEIQTNLLVLTLFLKVISVTFWILVGKSLAKRVSINNDLQDLDEEIV